MVRSGCKLYFMHQADTLLQIHETNAPHLKDIKRGQALAEKPQFQDKKPSTASKVGQQDGYKMEKGICSSPITEPRLQRNLSTSTVLQVRHPSSSLKTRPSPPASTATHRLSRDLDPRSLDASPTIRQTPLVKHTSAEQDSAISSSSDSDLAPPPPSRAQQQQQQQQHRPRTYSRQSYTNPATRRVSQAAPVNDAEGSEDSSPPFLPFSNNDVDAPKRTLEPKISDPSATLRITSHPQQSKAKAKPNAQAPNPKHLPQNLSQKRTSPSLTSSSSAQSHPTRPPTHQPALSSLSPKKHRRHLQGRHPLQSNSQNKTTSITSGSEPNSGIGSSFSDLDDADEDDDVDDDFSGTQSALEEALAGEMERGGGGLSSRLGGMSLVGRGQGRGR